MGEIADEHFARVQWQAAGNNDVALTVEEALSKMPNVAPPQRRGDCRYCGTAGLHWFLSTKKWMLIDESGNEHRCGPYVQGMHYDNPNQKELF